MAKVLKLIWEEVRKEQETIPAGCSYHLTQKDAESFGEAYWKSLAERAQKSNSDISADNFEPALVFETFSRPQEGSETWVEVSLDLLIEIQSSDFGVRSFT